MSYSKTLILVGNGSTLKDKRKGEVIDSFGVVSRMNNYVVRGFERDSGERVDYFCRRSTHDVHWCKTPDLKKVINFVTYCSGTAFMNGRAKNVRNIYNKKYVHVGSGFCQKIGEAVGINQPSKEWCSVGVLAIGYFCDVLDRPFYITGFDYVEGYEGKFKHYYPKSGVGSRGHNWAKEAIYIQKQIDLGKVKILP